MSDSEAVAKARGANAASLPPATFSFLTMTLRAQAEMNLGLFPMTNPAQRPDLNVAKHFIDLLGILQEKTKGNLSPEENKLLSQAVSDLRFRYVQKLQAGPKA